MVFMIQIEDYLQPKLEDSRWSMEWSLFVNQEGIFEYIICYRG